MTRFSGRLGELAARDVMTRDVITLSEGDTVARALQMFRHEQITGAPVVNPEGKLVGIVSLSDLFFSPDGGTAEAPGGTVGDRMSSNVVSVRDIAPLIEAARIMCVGHWHRVPVVDAYDRLCGIISTMDVLAALVNAADEAG